MKNDQKFCLNEYYGDFGGIFVPDSFTPDIDTLVKRSYVSLASKSFNDNFEKIIATLGASAIDLQRVTLANGKKIVHTSSKAELWNIAGQVALGLEHGAKLLAAGTGTPSLAMAFAKACHSMNIKGLLFLNRELSGDKELITCLEKLDCDVDCKICSELFNVPNMYAFQKFMENRQDRYFVPIEANVGPFPFPSLTGYFAGLYGEKLLSILPSVPECCVVSITSGTNAVGVFTALASSGCKLVTVEEPVAQENHCVYCGDFTLMTRMADSKAESEAICPELVNWWRMGKVIRLGCDHFGDVPGGDLDSTSLSKKSVRASALAFERIGCKEMLVVEAVI